MFANLFAKLKTVMNNENEVVLITDATITPELTALGYVVGDEMPHAPIIGEEDFEVTQEFLDLNPEITDITVGEIIKRPVLGPIPAKVVPPTEPVAPQAGEGTLAAQPSNTDGAAATAAVPDTSAATQEGTVAAPATPAQPQLVKVYAGKLVISEGTRELNGIMYRTLRLEDGTTYDLTDAQYEDQVVIEER